MLNSSHGDEGDVEHCSNLKTNFLTLQLLALSSLYLTHGDEGEVEHCSNLEANFLTLQLLALSISLLNLFYTLLHASIDLFLIATYTLVFYHFALRLVLIH